MLKVSRANVENRRMRLVFCIPVTARFQFVLVLFLQLSCLGHAEGIYSNSWVRPSSQGNLLYRHDEHGERIGDFSDCGYQGGMVALPEIYRKVDLSRWVNVTPLGGPADADRIQNAIDTVSQFTVNSNGFRGVVYLQAGEFRVDRTLLITNSGVVLKGVGSRGNNYTTIRATATYQHTLLSVTGAVERSFVSPYVNLMANPVVPAGTRTFKLFSTSDLVAGGQVLVIRPFTEDWISRIDMDKLRTVTCYPNFNLCVTNGQNFETDWTLQFERKVTRIDGLWVTVDTPIPSTFDFQYGGGFVQRTAWPERLSNIGIEDLNFDTLYDDDDDEDHGWRAIQFKNTEDAWVRNVTGKHFGFSLVDLSHGTRHITVAECQHSDPVSELAGNRRYPFHIDKGDYHLFRDCYSDDGRHDFAFGSLVPGPNANVRCQTHESHADTGPHMRWSVGGLYDLIDLDASWGADFLGKVGINVQNRGRNTGGHGWAGAYMTVWNCNAPTFRVRNPPTARNWLIGSIGYIHESQWWLPPVGADPAGTYELSGPYVPIQQYGQPTVGRHVNPYSLYFAQFQQKLRWPNSQFRELWVGDIDDFGEVASPEDTAPVNPTFLNAVRLNSGTMPVTRRFDDNSPTQRIAFTFTVPLIGSERVMAASLVLCMKATGPGAPDDVLYLDNPLVGVPLRAGGYGWTISQNKPTVETLEIDPALLADGQLNVSIKKNVMLDWAVLHAQVSPTATTPLPIVASGDTYVRGGSYKNTNYSGEAQMWVKNEGDGGNSRRAYLVWRSLPQSSRPLVGATVRLFCNASAQPGNVYQASVTEHDDWSENGLTWNNQIATLPPIAYFVPKPGEYVEFSLLPQVLQVLADDRAISLQIAAPYDLGDAGFATFATKEDPDPAKHPQLILQTANEPPNIFLPFSYTNMPANTQLTVPVAVSDYETTAGSLTLIASSSNPSLVPNQNLVLGGSGANRTLTITPLLNQTGQVEITLFVGDGVQTNSQKLNVRVGLPADSLVVSDIPDQTLSEHTSSPHIPFTITDTYGRANAVQAFVSFFGREQPVLVSFGSDDPPDTTTTNVSHRYIVFSPAANYSGVTTVSLQFTDGYSNVFQSVTVRVNAIDDPPGPITLIEPAIGQTFVPAQPLVLEASVVDRERDLARVEFYNQGMLLGSVLTRPYRFTWASPPAGSQPVTAVAVDLAGQRTESAPVTFDIGEAQNESPPFLAIQPAGDYVNLWWETDGRRMQLQASGQLPPGANWTNITSGFSSGTSGNSLTLPRNPSAPLFYRLIEAP